MDRIGSKTTALFILAVTVAFLLAYGIDQYYFAGRGYIFLFDILKL